MYLKKDFIAVIITKVNTYRKVRKKVWENRKGRLEACHP